MLLHLLANILLSVFASVFITEVGFKYFFLEMALEVWGS